MKRINLRPLAWLPAIAVLTATSPVVAQEKGEYVDDNVVKKAAEERPQGWDPTLSVGATINFTDNRAVVGQVEGSTWTLGANINGSLNYLAGSHDIRSTLVINETFTNTPTVPEFVNTADELRAEIVYYYNIKNLDWLGPFARAELGTSIFPGFAVFGEQKEFAVTDAGADAPRTVNDTRIQLRDSFAPLQLKQSVGAFARPIDKEPFSLELRLGGGAREVFADGQFAVQDNAMTPAIEVTGLRDYIQAGAEAAIKVNGVLAEKRVTYSVGVETLIPFFNSITPATGGTSPLDLANVEGTAKISFKLVEWASLDYQLRVLRQPLLIQDLQVQNNLLLTLGYTLIKREEAKASK